MQIANIIYHAFPMKCKLILGEQQKDVEIPGEDIKSEIRI